ncbi:MAG: FAD-dependent oxidoreductase [Deltaproteobacteria bacterium]|nr:FAD-dependent oxidoreductase [Deltaproteobacteria bacterium]
MIECDAIIPAIGQWPDMEWAADESALDISRWGTLQVDRHTMQTKMPHVFSAGDMVTGPATAIEARRHTRPLRPWTAISGGRIWVPLRRR